MHLQTLACTAALACLSTAACAADDHDHGPVAPTGAGPALTRFAATSETFELVGIVDGRQLVVYLDRFADNSPVKAAAIDLEIGGVKVALKERADGELEGTLAEALKPGVTPVTATVVVGTETDLLAADLDVHGEESVKAAARDWKPVAAWAAGAALLLLAIWALVRRRPGRRLQGAA